MEKACASLKDCPTELLRHDEVMLFGWLYRWANRHPRALAELTRDREREVQLNKRTQDLVRDGSSTSISQSICARVDELRSGLSDEQVVRLGASGLQALDIMLCRDTRLNRKHLQLPAPDGKVLLLADLPSPWTEALPADRQLDRDRGHQRVDVRSILDLHTRLVELTHDVAIDPRCLPEQVNERLRRRWERDGDLRVALAAPFALLKYDVVVDTLRSTRRGAPFLLRGMADQDRAAARRELAAIIAECRVAEVDVLLFPELSLDADLLDALRQILDAGKAPHPTLVVAGSTHCAVEDGRWANRAVVLDSLGRQLWQQEKCQDFRIPAVQVARMRPEFREVLGVHDGGIFEDIRLSKTIVTLESAIGRMSVLICLDYCGHEHAPLLADAGVTLLFVPAMTPQMKDFVDRARELGGACRATSFVANNLYMVRARENPVLELAYAYVPARRAARCWTTAAEGSFNVCTIQELIEGAK